MNDTTKDINSWMDTKKELYDYIETNIIWQQQKRTLGQLIKLILSSWRSLNRIRDNHILDYKFQIV